MNKHIDELILDYISGQLCSEDIEIFELNLKDNTKLQSQLEEAQAANKLLNGFDEIKTPEINQSMDDVFYTMLNKEKAKEKLNQKPKDKSLIDKFFSIEFLKPVLYGASMLFVGLFMGNIYSSKKSDYETNEKTIIAANYSNKMQELAVVSMLQLPSASKRLQAVSLVENSQNADTVVISALFETLNNDSNVNVRLAVLDSLAQFSNTPIVRTQLINSIAQQTSPMVQVAIADLMRYLQEGKAVEPLKKLLDDKNLIEPAREKILFAVNELI